MVPFFKTRSLLVPYNYKYDKYTTLKLNIIGAVYLLSLRQIIKVRVYYLTTLKMNVWKK